MRLRLWLARSLLALRRDVEAQAEISQCLRHQPRCALAYRLLGELAFRRDELTSARIFLRESVRLDDTDRDASELLSLVDHLLLPTAAVDKLPAAAAAVGASRSPPPIPPDARRTALGTVADWVAEPTRFGEYLVLVGVLTPAQLREVLAYHREHLIRVGAAAVELGYASGPTIEWAAHGFHAMAPC